MAEIPEVYNKVDQEPPDIKMLEGLVCPISHCALHYDKKLSELISKNVNLAFPIRDGIPILIISEARSLD
jgi:uncharacterized protein YbaR (Trm112 family)